MHDDNASSDIPVVEIAQTGDSRTSLETRLEENLPGFTSSQQQIAAYILGHPDRAAYQSMSQLATTIGVSNAAITRFLKAAGIASGGELKGLIARHIREKMGIAGRLGKKLKNVGDATDLFSSVVELEIEYLQKCIREVPPNLIEDAATIISERERVLIWSQRPYWGLVDLLEYRLSRLSRQAIPIIESGHYVLDKGHTMNSDDVLIGLAFQRSPTDLEMLFDLTRRKGTASILLTDLPLIPTKLSADVVISARRGPSGVSNSHIVPMAIINAIILATGKQLVTSGFPVMNELDELRQKYGYEYGYPPLQNRHGPNEPDE